MPVTAPATKAGSEGVGFEKVVVKQVKERRAKCEYVPVDTAAATKAGWGEVDL